GSGRAAPRHDPAARALRAGDGRRRAARRDLLPRRGQVRAGGEELREQDAQGLYQGLAGKRGRVGARAPSIQQQHTGNTMSGNSFGTLYCVTSFGESHGPALGGVVDGCPPGMALSEADIQGDLDRRKPGTSRHVTQRRESDSVELLSGIFEGRTTGTAIGFIIRNEDARSKDYSAIAETFRPGHADYSYWQKYGIRDYRGGGRSSARETAVRVVAGAIARKWLRERYGVEIRGYLS